MHAKIVQATIEPTRVGEAARAVHEELVPRFRSLRGARHGWWMAEPRTGRILAVTLWSDLGALRAARTVDGIGLAQTAERINLGIRVVRTMEVVADHRRSGPLDDQPVVRWVRATWVDALTPGVLAALPGLHAEVAAGRRAEPGYCRSLWLADRATGTGLSLSCWDGPAELSGSRRAAARRGREVEARVGCRATAVEQYSALGVSALPVLPVLPPTLAPLGAG